MRRRGIFAGGFIREFTKAETLLVPGRFVLNSLKPQVADRPLRTSQVDSAALPPDGRVFVIGGADGALEWVSSDPSVDPK